MQTEKSFTNKTPKRKGNLTGNEELSKKPRKDIDNQTYTPVNNSNQLEDYNDVLKIKNILNVNNNSDTSSDDCEIVSVSLNNNGQLLPKYRKIDVPGDNSCLFWAVTLAYLTPVKDDDNVFKTRFQKLFGHQNYLSKIQQCIQKYDHNIPNNDIFKKLVTQDFRNMLCDYISNNKERFNFQDPLFNKKSDEKLDNKELEYHIQQMQKITTWGSSLEQEAMALMLECNIYTYSNAQTHQVYPIVNKKTYDDKLILHFVNAETKNYDTKSANHFMFSLLNNSLEQADSGDAVSSVIEVDLENSNSEQENDQEESTCNEFDNDDQTITDDSNLKQENVCTAKHFSNDSYDFENKKYKSLHDAAREGDISAVKDLLIKGTDVNARDHDGCTALHYAAQNGNDGIVAMLLKHNADIINTQDSMGFTALHYAARNGNDNTTVAILLEHNANVGATDLDQCIALHYAARNGNDGIVAMLLKHNADIINTQDSMGFTALHYAARNGNDGIVAILLEHNANVGATTYLNQCTALHLAAYNGNDGIVAMLLKHNADIINAQNSMGFTALHYALMTKYVKVIQVLLGNKLIDISISDNNGNTPYDLALTVAEYYYPEIIDLFQSKQHISETGSLKTDNTAISNNLADCELKFNPNLNNETISDFQQPELHEKQDLNTLPINTNNDQGEVSSLCKQEIYKKELSIAKKFLELGVAVVTKGVGLPREIVENLEKGNADYIIATNNNKELVTQSKSLESSRNVLDEEEYPDPGIKYDVPGDGNCLFWSIFYAYLLPVRQRDEEFKERFEKMFPDHDYNSSLKNVQKKFQSLRLNNLNAQDKDLIPLIQKLRKKAYNEVKSSADKDKIHVTPTKQGNQHKDWAEKMANAQYNNGTISSHYWGEEKGLNALASLLNIKIDVYRFSEDQYNKQLHLINLYAPFEHGNEEDSHRLETNSDITIILLLKGEHYNFY